MNQSTGAKPLLLLTGAAGRFGECFVQAFCERFDIVAITNTKQLPTRTEETVFDAISGEHISYPIRQIPCDLTDFDATRRTIRTVCVLCGPPIYVVNAAADIRFHCPTLTFQDNAEKALRQMAVNAFAPVLITSVIYQECWKQISPSDQQASVLNVSSVSGVKFHKGTEQATYAASKTALNMFTLHMADEYRPYNIKIGAIAPGRFTTQTETLAAVEKAAILLFGSKTGQIVVE